jgi:Uma2 family endonuclease
MKAEEPIFDYAQLDLNGTYTYMDYLRWHFKERVELIRGKVFKMSPAPNTNHQTILLNLGVLFSSFFDKQSCSVFLAPFDVRLPIAKPWKDHTVVQPDVSVICDASKLDKLGCAGSPDLVVEIISPGNPAHDKMVKFDLYEEAGIKEYWIVEPDNRLVLLYRLQDGKYAGLKPYLENQTINSILFPDLKIKVNDIFKKMI